jgi:hypothetical protein
MSDLKTEVNGITIICKSDGTALVDGGCGVVDRVLVLRGFIEVKGKRYVLTEIGHSAFFDSAIKSIRIPSGIEGIGRGCFSRCKSLCGVIFELDSKLKEIGPCAFVFWCEVESIRIPRNVEMIGEACYFFSLSLCEVAFESGSKLKAIGKSAFCRWVKCIRVPLGFTVEYKWPRDCLIEYYDEAVATERRN